MRRSTMLAVALTLLLVPGDAARAQGATIHGVVRDTAGAPIPFVEVTGPAGTVVADTVGRFRLDGLAAGVVGIALRRLGYRATTWQGTVSAGSALPLELTMTPVPRDLEPVVIAAGNDFASRQLRGFYARRQRSHGHFLTREQIEPHDDSRLTDVLRARIPSVQLSGGAGRTRLRLRGQRCAPLVWIDGAPTPAGEFDLDVIQPSSVAGIEVYLGPGMVPIEFTLPMSRDSCGGSIIIWSRFDTRSDEEQADAILAVKEIGSPRVPVYRADEVDEPAAIDTAALVPAVYPDSLRVFAIAGSATAQFVVDTTGAPVAGTIEVISATDPAFGLAAARAIAVSRFIPARHEGRAVRQVLVLPFTFTTGRR